MCWVAPAGKCVARERLLLGASDGLDGGISGAAGRDYGMVGGKGWGGCEGCAEESWIQVRRRFYPSRSPPRGERRKKKSPAGRRGFSGGEKKRRRVRCVGGDTRGIGRRRRGSLGMRPLQWSAYRELKAKSRNQAENSNQTYVRVRFNSCTGQLYTGTQTARQGSTASGACRRS